MSTAKEYIARGSAQYDKHDLVGAADSFSRAIALAEADNSPDGKLDLAQAHYMRASAYSLGRDWHRAIKDFSRVLDLTEHARAYIYRGLAYDELGDPDRALNDLNKGIALKPDHAHAYDVRSLVRRKTGDLDGAIEDGTKAIQLNPTSASAYGNRGVTHKVKGNLEYALSDLTKAIELDPSLAVPYHERALVIGMMANDLLNAGKQSEKRFSQYLLLEERDLQRALQLQRERDPNAGLSRLGETEMQIERRLWAVQELISRFPLKSGCAAVLALVSLSFGLAYLLHRLA